MSKSIIHIHPTVKQQDKMNEQRKITSQLQYIPEDGG